MLPIRTVLHPTDFSDLSRPAFELASALARDYGATLVLLHVAPIQPVLPPNEGDVPLPLIDTDRLREQLDALQPTTPVAIVRRLLVEGEPVEEIVRAAAEMAVDLIVLGTHGRNGLSRLLMGSVAEAVQRTAPCPVVTVRPAARRKQAATPAAA